MIRFRDKTILRLKADSHADRKAWVVALRAAVNRVQACPSPTISEVSASTSPRLTTTPAAMRHSQSRTQMFRGGSISAEALPSPTRSCASDNTEFTSISSSLMPSGQAGEFVSLSPLVTPDQQRPHRSAGARNRYDYQHTHQNSHFSSCCCRKPSTLLTSFTVKRKSVRFTSMMVTALPSHAMHLPFLAHAMCHTAFTSMSARTGLRHTLSVRLVSSLASNHAQPMRCKAPRREPPPPERSRPPSQSTRFAER